MPNVPTYVWPIVASIAAVTIIVIVIYLVLKKKHQSRIGQNVVDDKIIEIDNTKWQNSLGGASNILEVEAKGSRLIVKLNDTNLINKDELHNLGVDSVILSASKITLVIKDNAEKVAKLLQ